MRQGKIKRIWQKYLMCLMCFQKCLCFSEDYSVLRISRKLLPYFEKWEMIVTAVFSKGAFPDRRLANGSLLFPRSQVVMG